MLISFLAPNLWFHFARDHWQVLWWYPPVVHALIDILQPLIAWIYWNVWTSLDKMWPNMVISLYSLRVKNNAVALPRNGNFRQNIHHILHSNHHYYSLFNKQAHNQHFTFHSLSILFYICHLVNTSLSFVSIRLETHSCWLRMDESKVGVTKSYFRKLTSRIRPMPIDFPYQDIITLSIIFFLCSQYSGNSSVNNNHKPVAMMACKLFVCN